MMNIIKLLLFPIYWIINYDKWIDNYTKIAWKTYKNYRWVR